MTIFDEAEQRIASSIAAQQTKIESLEARVAALEDAESPSPVPGPGHGVGLIWQGDFAEGWPAGWPMRWGPAIRGEAGWSIAAHDDLGWLRCFYPEGRAGDGIQWRTRHDPRDRMYLEYKVRFPENFEWVKGGKLPGLSGGAGATGGNLPRELLANDPPGGWSVRLMWRAGGEGEAYVYHLDYPTKEGQTGDRTRSNSFTFQKGKIHQIGLEVVLNTPTKLDGSVQIWLDNKIVMSRINYRFRQSLEPRIDRIHFDTIFGGSTPDFAPVKSETVDFSDFKLFERRGE